MLAVQGGSPATWFACRGYEFISHGPETTSVKNIAILAFILVNCCISAMAVESKATGFYAGGAAGVTELDDDGAFDGANFDDEDTGFTLFGGYKFLRWVAAEARLSDLGSYRVSSNFSSFSTSIDLRAISVHVVGMYPFGNSGWELFGQLGIGSIEVDSDCCGSDDQTVGSAGIGVRYYPTANIGISLQTDAFVWEEDGLNGNNYDPAVGITQVGVQYLF